MLLARLTNIKISVDNSRIRGKLNIQKPAKLLELWKILTFLEIKLEN